MNFEWAITELKQGKKVRRPSWKENSYWMFGIDEVINWNNEEEARVHLNQIEATDWEVYCEEHDWEEHGCTKPLKKYYICKICGKEKKIYEDEETLSDKRFAENEPAYSLHEPIYLEKDVKEKIQNAQMRLKEAIKKEGDKDHIPYEIKEIDKIFKEEFGGKLT